MIYGVKQGGILLPILVSIYMEELLFKLKKHGSGCHIGNVFVAALWWWYNINISYSENT